MKSFLIILLTVMLVQNSQTQSWLDQQLYPFESHFLELESGNLHYLDEGTGEVLLFVHGTPTWSFLYRDFISELSTDYRCIALDHLGFGLSDPQGQDFAGTPQAHAANLSALIQKLDLRDITLVVHDFGGPIGLGAALENEDRIKQVVVFNTWLWSTKENVMAQEIDQLLNSEVGEDLYLKQNFSPVVLLKQAFSDSTHLTPEIHQHYIAPFPTPTSRQSLLKVGKSFAGASDWYQQQWERLDLLQEKGWLVLWGTKDPFLDVSFRDRWAQRFPQAKVVSFDSGHFVQEEKTAEAIQVLQDWLRR
ncbi:MAG: alpha/beta fold hydrolase [Bacteroidota bacterium]